MYFAEVFELIDRITILFSKKSLCYYEKIKKIMNVSLKNNQFSFHMTKENIYCYHFLSCCFLDGESIDGFYL